MKSILVDVNAEAGRESRLQVALDLARAFSGHVGCVQATPPAAYISTDMFGGAFVISDIIDAVMKRADKVRSEIETQLAREDVSWDFVHCEANAEAALAGRARLADVVVMSRHPWGKGSPDAPSFVADVALHCRTPILALPETAACFDPAGRAVILWNGSVEAGVAVRAALPLLARSSAVTVLTMADETHDFPAVDVCEYLSRHGIESEIDALPLGDTTVADALLSAVRRISPAYVVMGAYGRSRAAEFLLGGVTRQMLSECPVPLLLAH